MKQIHQENPWILPYADDKISDFFLKHGNNITVAKGEIIVPVEKYINRFVYVVDGLVGQNMVNYALNKPIAMALGFKGAYFGYRQYFTRRRSRCYIESLRKSTVITIDYDKVATLIDNDMELLKCFMKGCIRSVESDLESMIAMFSLTPEERLKGFLTSLFERMGTDVNKEWVQIPYKFKYEEMAKIIYVTKVTLDRIYISWKRSGVYKKEGDGYFIKKDFLNDVEDWTKETDAP